MQGLWWKSNLWAKQAKITMQGLWRKSNLWAQQEKIRVRHMTPCWGCTRPCLYGLEKRQRNEYLGCNIETFKKHTEQHFTEGMSWENYGEWQIDHKIPLKHNKPLLEKVDQRLHCTDTQPMWASEIMSKGFRYISDWPWPLFISGWPWTNVKSMGNCLSKFNHKSFTLHTPPLTTGHLKKGASGIRKNPVKYFASGIHRNYGYEIFT